MSDPESTEPQPSSSQRVGPAHDFKDFIELEFERRRSSQKDFDAVLFDEAVTLVMKKING